MKPRNNLLFVALVVAIIASSCHGGFIKDGKYKIQNIDDKLFLTVLGDGKMCQNLAPVITLAATEAASSVDQIWQTTWWGTVDDKLGIHLHHDKSVNELTFADYPPYCYLVYNDLDLIEIEHTKDIYQIRIRDTQRCLVSNGSGKRATFEACYSKTDKQQWKFEPVPTPRLNAYY